MCVNERHKCLCHKIFSLFFFSRSMNAKLTITFREMKKMNTDTVCLFILRNRHRCFSLLFERVNSSVVDAFSVLMICLYVRYLNKEIHFVFDKCMNCFYLFSVHTLCFAIIKSIRLLCFVMHHLFRNSQKFHQF